MFCFTQVSWSHQNSIYCTGKYVYATKVFPHSAVYVLILTNLYFGIIKYDKRRYFMCTLDSFLQGKWHDHVWDFPAPIIPWEESRVWLWHVCFPTSLRPVCSPPPDSLSRAAGAWEQMSHLHTERFVFWKCGRRGTETTEERGLWWLFAGCWTSKLFLNIILQIIAPWRLQAFEMTRKSIHEHTHCRLFTDCLEYAV